MNIGLIVVKVVLCLTAVGWLLTALKVWRKRQEATWAITPDSPGVSPDVTVSIIIPARDEVGNIGACVAAALAQDHAALQVVVLDDGSTDGTSQILAELAAQWPDRLVVLRGGDAPLPKGWLGKPWACQRASKVATGAWLLFIDADVRLRPHAVSAAVAWAVDHELGMLSGLGHLDTASFWERVLQPAVGALIMAGNDLDQLNDPEHRSDRPLANGQFILLERRAYGAVGGHGAVAGAVLDDVGMATAIVGSGAAYNLLMMRELFSCRMYDSLGALWEGWTKNLFTGIRRSFGLLVFLTIWLLGTVFLPFALVPLAMLGLVPASLLWWGLAVSGIMLLVRAYLDVAYDMDPRYGPTQPLAVLMLVALLWHSALRTVRGTASWKGRTLDLDPSEGQRH
ncbi:MAG: glycosyltransferase [Oligoflexia bacterium]|nr:glycosyltransferase [Oligoflexia bacterium]